MLEIVENTPLGRDNKPEDPGIIIRCLDNNDIDITKYAQFTLQLYRAAGEPKYEKDLLVHRDEMQKWRHILGVGQDLTLTTLAVDRENGVQLTNRERELLDKSYIYKYEIEDVLLLPESGAKYPEYLIKLAARQKELRLKALSGGQKADIVNFLNIKQVVESQYVQILIDNLDFPNPQVK
jgi:hypothetical protein